MTDDRVSRFAAFLADWKPKGLDSDTDRPEPELSGTFFMKSFLACYYDFIGDGDRELIEKRIRDLFKRKPVIEDGFNKAYDHYGTEEALLAWVNTLLMNDYLEKKRMRKNKGDGDT